MKPHPAFADRYMPGQHALGGFKLNALSVHDLDRDFSAVTASATAIKAAHPGTRWPYGLTKERNLVDLAWHQREFETRRGFAWVIESSDSEYLGCPYVYPSIAGNSSADVL
jgi:hypothetical protein